MRRLFVSLLTITTCCVLVTVLPVAADGEPAADGDPYDPSGETLSDSGDVFIDVLVAMIKHTWSVPWVIR